MKTTAAPEQRTQTATLRFAHVAPRKMRLIAHTLAGLPVREAEAQLLLRPQRAAGPLLKLLRSAIANARSSKQMPPSNLVISVIRVDEGPMLKRFLPRAQGRATPIHKKTSHVSLVLAETAESQREQFVITPRPKKEKKPEKKRRGARLPASETAHEAKREEGGAERRPGFFRRIFRRKSI